MFLAKAESSLKRVFRPIARHKLRRMTEQGFPAHLCGSIEFLFNRLIDETTQATVQKIENIRSELTERHSELRVIRSSGDSEPCLIVDRQLGWLVDVASITKYWGTFLHLCANAIRAERILELGSCVGISSCYLASSKYCKEFITVEGSNMLAPIAKSNLKKIRSDFRLMNALFDEALNVILLTVKDRIDLIFIDGDHTKSATLRYFHRIKPILRDGSVVLFDDIHWSAEMYNAWQTICEQPGLEFTANLGRIGLCIWKGGEGKPINYDLSKFTIDWGKGSRKNVLVQF